MSETARTAAAGGAAVKRELSALRQIKESAQALLREGKTEETWELLLCALESVLSRNCDLELLAWALSRSEPGLLARIDPPPVLELAEE